MAHSLIETYITTITLKPNEIKTFKDEKREPTEKQKRQEVQKKTRAQIMHLRYTLTCKRKNS